MGPCHQLGALASTESSQRADVGTYLGNLPQLEGHVAFPTATVNAMSLVRTFWEKATLIHFENTRNDRAIPAERYARHWYDLHARSHRSNLVDQALTDRSTRTCSTQAHRDGSDADKLKTASDPPKALFQRLERDAEHDHDDDHHGEAQIVANTELAYERDTLWQPVWFRRARR